MIRGYDIAGYQPENFLTAGIDFVFIKITEGIGFTNPNWIGQRTTARKADLVTGFYHFARPGSMKAQADFFLSKINLLPEDILAFDWEDPGVTGADKDSWIKYVKSLVPNKVIMYCNKDFWFNRDKTGYAGDGLWIADPSSPAGQPAVSAPFVLHQYSETNGYDHDVAVFNSRAAMAAWAAGGETTVALTEQDAFTIWAYTHGDEADMHAQLVTAASKSTAAATSAAAGSTSAATAASKSTAAATSAAAAAASAATAASGTSAANTTLSVLSTKIDGIASTLAGVEATGITPEQVTQISNDVSDAVTATLMSEEFLTAVANKFADVQSARLAD